MRYLVDTHILIWYGENNPVLHPSTLDILNNPSNQLLVSHASLWEIAIKVSLDKLKLSVPLDQMEAELVRNGFALLPFEFSHYNTLAILPFHHNDPFDRMIIAQAISEQLEVVSYDEKFKLYDLKLA